MFTPHKMSHVMCHVSHVTYFINNYLHQIFHKKYIYKKNLEKILLKKCQKFTFYNHLVLKLSFTMIGIKTFFYIYFYQIF